ncbi:MAG: copper amine oxidase N-terminal domain-containing protein [Peptococcaceae bacterium]|jgi:hypothetical protein|nr:copper amine oxidase N-terminal domain-containing protein [Peptococcaceae bacterium]MDH7524523.1 copper amine oxidase N-terminal domain-containing protein [Peptococcaceae bacterium]
MSVRAKKGYWRKASVMCLIMLAFTLCSFDAALAGPYGGGSTPPSQETPPATPITENVKTDDDRALDQALRQTGKAVLSLGGAAAARFSPAVANSLAQAKEPLTLEKPGVSVQFSPQALQAPEITGVVQKENAVIEIGVEVVSTAEANSILAGAPLGQSTGLFSVGGIMVDLSAQVKTGTATVGIDGFPEPVAVTVDLSSLGTLTQEEINQLTGVRLEKDAAGNIVAVSLGGTYDPVKKTFTFYTDRFSYYTVMKNTKLVKIVLTLNNSTAVLNGNTKTLDSPATLVNNRTMVPLRFVAESLGVKVDWIGATRTVKMKLDGKELSLVIDQTIPGLDVPAKIINSRTMVPLRYVSESFGASVKWFPSTYRVEVVR